MALRAGAEGNEVNTRGTRRPGLDHVSSILRDGRKIERDRILSPKQGTSSKANEKRTVSGGQHKMAREIMHARKRKKNVDAF